MNIPDAVVSFSALAPGEQAEFLALLAHELTIVARDPDEVGQDGLTDPARMRVINEIQHRVTAALIAMLKSDPRRYPDDVLVRIVLEHPEDTGLQQQLAGAFCHAMALIGATT